MLPGSWHHYSLLWPQPQLEASRVILWGCTYPQPGLSSAEDGRAMLVQPSLLNGTTPARLGCCRANEKAQGTWRAGQNRPSDHKNISTEEGVQKAYNYPHQKALHQDKLISLPSGWSRRANLHSLCAGPPAPQNPSTLSATLFLVAFTLSSLPSGNSTHQG